MLTSLRRIHIGYTIGSLVLFAFATTAPTTIQAADKAPDESTKPIAAKDAVVKEYLAVQQLLANDKFEGVQTHLSKIRDAAKAIGTESQDADVKKQAEEIAKNATEPKDLKEARKSFKPLSSAIIALVQVNPPSADVATTLYEVNCPMVKADWLQTSKEITNPYMGQEMLSCGSVTKTIKSAPAEEEKKK